MEGMEMEISAVEGGDMESDDIFSSILSRFSSSTKDNHQHLCATVGTMSQELKDKKLPLSPVSCFGVTCSSLDCLSAEAQPPPHIVDALVTTLSIVLPRVPASTLRNRNDYLSNLLVRVLNSKSVTDAAVASALKCIAHLLIIGDKGSDLPELYRHLLSYATDNRQKVRKQAHISLCDALRSFQRTPVLARASKEITETFQKLILFTDGSNANTSEGHKGALEILYFLDALRDCLPLLSSISSTNILKHFKSLLKLRQPIVTRRITNCLNALCLHPTSEASPEEILDLFCILCAFISANEMTADDMTFTARLLDVGMKKIYSFDRQICVAKLPLVFNTLRDILGNEYEEALFAATEVFKNLIHACIDGDLIKQGIDQITDGGDLDTGKSAPTIIEKVCATVESLLDYSYAAVWDLSFQVVSTMFDKLGVHSFYLLKGTLKNLADMQSLSDKDFPYRKQLHECIGSAVSAMGPERFLTILPLKLESGDLSEANVWMLPILKQHIIGASLDFFTRSVLAMVKVVKKKSQMLEQQGKIHSSRSVDGLVYSLWSLLPSFCNYPTDVAESFQNLGKPLRHALRTEVDLRGIICSSLQLLIQQNNNIVEGKIDLSCTEGSNSRQQAIARYSPQIAAGNLKVLKLFSGALLSELSEIFMETSVDAGGCLQSTIGELASISNKEARKLFIQYSKKLQLETLKAGEIENSLDSDAMETDFSSNLTQRARLLDLAVAFLPGLGPEEVDFLFESIKPTLEDGEGVMQKKAYKVLSIILKSSDEFLSRKLEELLKLMIDVLPSCHFAAKRHRLDCLQLLTIMVSKDETKQRWHSIASSFLTEIVLSLKETNKKTRNKAYDIIVQIGHACENETDGEKNLEQFFDMVAGGLAGDTPHMISAALKGLARLAYEFTDLVSAVYKVLPSAFLLLKRKNREIVKADLGLLKVLVAKSQNVALQMHLKSMVEGLLMWQDSTKNHFKAKIKVLLEMLVKKCGLEAVKAVMPEEHLRLLTNIRKVNERKERKATASSEESRSQKSKATTSRLSRWNHTKIFSDYGDEEEDDSDMDMKTKASARLTSGASTLVSKRTRKASKSLPEDLADQLEDEPLNLLDRGKTRSALRSNHNLKRKQGRDDDEPEIDSEGRLIIHEEGERTTRERLPDGDSDGRSQAGGSHLSSMNSQRGGQKKRKTSESGWAYTGSEYASKKASGDVKRKGKLEPYAYWPLDRKMMSRRPEHRAAARKGMANVVKLTKRMEGKSVSGALSLREDLKFKKTKRKVDQKKRRSSS